MKKKISMFLAVMTLLTLIVSPLMYVRAADDEDDEVPAPDVTHAKAAALYNVENDYFMYTKNAEEQMYPASTVKLMTAIIVMEALGTDLDREITATREALSKVQGNHIKIRRDEILTARQLLSAMLIGNANDATNILAIEVAGSIEAFVSMMNDKAEEIGATHTYYMNPTGIHHPSMKTTAEDTAKMNKAFGKTTWNPKPVWVMFSDGSVYMASTHNTPHGTYNKKNINNFAGHLCVHFPRTKAEVEAIGPYATSHQKAIDQGWEVTQKRAGR